MAPASTSETQVTQPSTSSSNCKQFMVFWLSPLLILLIALSFSFKSFNLLTRHQNPSNSPPRPPCVLWMAPFFSSGGYSSEAWSYIQSLEGHHTLVNLRIEHHGDLNSVEFWLGLPEESKSMAYKLHTNSENCPWNDTVVVCHSEPGAWNPPLFQTNPCPPTEYKEPPRFVIGRTMFETDRLNIEHVNRCNKMDEVWVPTDFHVSTFVNSGVNQSKVVKIVQPVDVAFFDPAKYDKLVLPIGNPVIGGKIQVYDDSNKVFVFLSVFKWEYRKGWDVLLKSYLQEFSKLDRVALHILTNAYHTDNKFTSEITKFIEDHDLKEPPGGWALVYVIDRHVAQLDLARLYKAADAFVLPTRGEGWGRPVVEAMAMEVPVIVTNWSGPTEYLTEDNGYPLMVDRMTEVLNGPFKGHLYAEPSATRLKELLRHVMNNRAEAEMKGKIARKDMIEKFSPDVVANIVSNRITKIYTSRSR